MTYQTKTAGSATLSYAGKTVDLPVLSGTTGPDVIDIRKLYGATDAFTFDPGFTSTAACESGLTFIDGDQGTLLHRGYPIDQLAKHSNFVEVCHLLLHGELPTASEYASFERGITMHTMLHSQFDRFFEGFRRDAHPMAIMVGTVGALSAFYHDSLDIHDPVQRNISAIRLIAKMPTIAARAFKYSVGQPFIHPKNDLNYAENFLRSASGGQVAISSRARKKEKPPTTAMCRPEMERIWARPETRMVSTSCGSSQVSWPVTMAAATPPAGRLTRATMRSARA